MYFKHMHAFKTIQAIVLLKHLKYNIKLHLHNQEQFKATLTDWNLLLKHGFKRGA